MGPVVITTERLNLREWTLEDRDAFARIGADPAVTRFIHHGVPLSAEEVDRFIQRQLLHQRERGWCRWAVELREPPGGIIGFWKAPDVITLLLQPLDPYREYLTIISNTDVRMAEAFFPPEIGGDHFRFGFLMESDGQVQC